MQGYRYVSLLHCPKGNVLPLNQRLVYSVLLTRLRCDDRAKKRHFGTSKNYIVRLLGFHHSTVTKVMKRLSELDLVRVSGRRWFPQEPKAGQFEVKRDTEGKVWFRRFASGQFFIPADGSPLTWSAVAVYSQVRINRKTGYRVTIKGLATVLGMSRATVRRSLDLLHSEGLIDDNARLTELTAEQRTLFKARRRKPSRKERALFRKIDERALPSPAEQEARKQEYIKAQEKLVSEDVYERKRQKMHCNFGNFRAVCGFFRQYYGRTDDEVRAAFDAIPEDQIGWRSFQQIEQSLKEKAQPVDSTKLEVSHANCGTQDRTVEEDEFLARLDGLSA